MSECKNFWILSHLSEWIDAPAGCTGYDERNLGVWRIQGRGVPDPLLKIKISSIS